MKRERILPSDVVEVVVVVVVVVVLSDDELSRVKNVSILVVDKNLGRMIRSRGGSLGNVGGNLISM